MIYKGCGRSAPKIFRRWGGTEVRMGGDQNFWGWGGQVLMGGGLGSHGVGSPPTAENPAVPHAARSGGLLTKVAQVWDGNTWRVPTVPVAPT